MRSLLFLFLILIVAKSAAYSQTQNLTLEKAIQIALENNADTQIAKMEVKKAHAAVDEAFGYALPSVNFNASYSHFIEKPVMPFPDFEALLNNSTYGILLDQNLIPEEQANFLPIENVLQAFALTNNYEASAEVSQILFNSAVFRGIGASEIYLQMSEEMLFNSIANTVVNVKSAFYGALLAQEMLDITNASFKNFQDNYESVKKLFEAGLASEYDAMQAEVQLENFRPMIAEAENALQNAKDGLKVLLDIDQSLDINLEGSLDYQEEPTPIAEELTNKADENNFQIRTLQKKIEVDDAFVDLDRAGFWPTVSAFGNYTWGGASEDLDFQNFTSSIVGLSFSINLFDGMRKYNKIEQSLIEKEKTREQLSQARNYISSQIRAKINDIEKVKKNIKAQERTVDLAQKTYEIASVRLKEGTGTQLELLNAETQLRQAKTNRLKYYYDYIVAKSTLDQLTGNIDPKLIEKYSKIDNN